MPIQPTPMEKAFYGTHEPWVFFMNTIGFRQVLNPNHDDPHFRSSIPHHSTKIQALTAVAESGNVAWFGHPSSLAVFPENC